MSRHINFDLERLELDARGEIVYTYLNMKPLLPILPHAEGLHPIGILHILFDARMHIRIIHVSIFFADRYSYVQPMLIIISTSHI